MKLEPCPQCDDISKEANELLDQIRDSVLGYSVNTICVAVAFLLLELSESDCVTEVNADDSIPGQLITKENMVELVSDVVRDAQLQPVGCRLH